MSRFQRRPNKMEYLRMSESLWGKPGATLSHKNACKEFGLSEDEVIEAIKKGKLQYRQNYAHGNPYFRLLRVEVETLARQLHGDTLVEEQEIKHKLQMIDKEINSSKRRLASLERQRSQLLDAQKQRNA
jgi:hypothetical protein